MIYSHIQIQIVNVTHNNLFNYVKIRKNMFLVDVKVKYFYGMETECPRLERGNKRHGDIFEGLGGHLTGLMAFLHPVPHQTGYP